MKFTISIDFGRFHIILNKKILLIDRINVHKCWGVDFCEFSYYFSSSNSENVLVRDSSRRKVSFNCFNSKSNCSPSFLNCCISSSHCCISNSHCFISKSNCCHFISLLITLNSTSNNFKNDANLFLISGFSSIFLHATCPNEFFFSGSKNAHIISTLP